MAWMKIQPPLGPDGMPMEWAEAVQNGLVDEKTLLEILKRKKAKDLAKIVHAHRDPDAFIAANPLNEYVKYRLCTKYPGDWNHDGKLTNSGRQRRGLISSQPSSSTVPNQSFHSPPVSRNSPPVPEYRDPRRHPEKVSFLSEHSFFLIYEGLHTPRRPVSYSASVSCNPPPVPEYRDPKRHPEEESLLNEHGFPPAWEEQHLPRQPAPSSSFVSRNSPLVPHYRDPKSHPEEKVLLNELGFPLTYEELHSSRRQASSSASVSLNPPPLVPDNHHPRKHPEEEYPLNAHGIPLTYEAPLLPPRPVVLPLQQPHLSHQSQEHTPESQ